MGDKSEPANAEKLRVTFLGIVTRDVLVAHKRLEHDESQTSRRDFIRTLFAAVEGIVWQFRENIRGAAEDLGELSPQLAMALTETSYSVGENGKLIEQQRFIPLPTMIRLVTNVAKELAPALEIEINGEGWGDLKRTIVIRNRVTHPKGISDLNISSDDTKAAWSGLFWLLSYVERVMEAVCTAQADYLHHLKTLVKELKAGDPAALEAYRKAFTERNE